MELMVVMVLIGIVGSIVFVSVSSSVLRSSKSRFTMGFAQELVSAKSAGLAGGRPVNFRIDSGQRRYGWRNWHPIPESVQIEGEGIGRCGEGIYCVTFYPDGSSSGGRIDLVWEKGRVDRIRIDPLLGTVALNKGGGG